MKPFKILSIDGGGIRGVFPAKFLANLESKLKADGKNCWQIYQNFDLILGTSTGGILAIALSLGIPADTLYSLYINNAFKIFGHKKGLLGQIFYAGHERNELEKLIQGTFKEANGGVDPLLNDCKTPVCIPIYDLLLGKPSALKSPYHKRFVRDFHIPAYKAAMATSAAPTFFEPYSTEYTDMAGVKQSFSNKVDGGIMANNPTLFGIVEAQKAFGQPLNNLKVLSIGTGHQKFTDGMNRKNWGLWYWMRQNKKTRLIDLFMQGQSQQVQNLVTLLQLGIDKEHSNEPAFFYHRIDTTLDDTLKIALDETDTEKLKRLGEKATSEFQNNANTIIQNFCL